MTPHDRAAARLAMAPFLVAAGAMFAVMYSTQAILPDLGREFGVSPSQAGLSISVVIGALAIGAWFWGPLSDRIGRRASLVLASGAIVVPTLLVALAPSFPSLLGLRALQGLCMPGLITVGVPYVTEAYAPALGSRAMGYYIAALVAGGLVGRVGVALLTAALDWRVALGLLTLLPLVSTLLMRRGLPPEPAVERRSAPLSLRDARRVLGNRVLLGATLAGSALFFAFTGAFSFVEFRLERPPFSLSPAVGALVFLVWVFGAAGPFAGREADRRGWRAVALAGLTVAAAGVSLSLVDVLAPALVGLALITLGNFSGVTAAQLGVAASTERDRGLASALYFSSYYLAGALGSYVPGLAFERWEWPGVAALALGAYAVGALAVLAAPGRASGLSANVPRSS
jgi:MFS transporter, YNFM family, putative membrane transport protein